MPFEYTPTATTIALWRFNGSLVDATGHGHNWTAFNPGSLVYTGGILNQSVSLNEYPSPHYLTMNDPCGLGLGLFTVSQWFCFPGDIDYGDHVEGITIFNSPVSLSYAGIEFYSTGSGAYAVYGTRSYVIYPETTRSVVCTYNTSIVAGTWHNVTFTWDGINKYRLYFDGVCKNEKTESDSGTYDTGVTQAARINAYGGDLAKNINIDETILDGRVWTPEEISLYCGNRNTLFQTVHIPGI